MPVSRNIGASARLKPYPPPTSSPRADRWWIRLYLDQLDTTKAHLDSLLSNTSDNLQLLSELSTSFKSVDAQTSAFREQCQGLISAQKQSTRLSDDINENLRYYDYLEPITRRLNAPGAGSMVRSKDFSGMLRNLDESIDYMESHVRYRSP